MRVHIHVINSIAALLLISGNAIAQPLAAPELPSPQQNQTAEPGYLGLIADDRQENGRGARVKDVVESSPAGQYGLKTGDLITAINGQPVKSLDAMGAIQQTLSAGSKVAFEIERNGQSQVVEVTLGRRPPPEERRFQNFGRIPETVPNQTQSQSQSQSGLQSPSASGLSPVPNNRVPPRPLLGVQTLPVTEETRARLRLQSTAGALITSRTLGSPAERANIPLDAVIVALDGQRVGNPNDLSALLAQAGEGKTVEITYLYNGESPHARVTLGMGTGAAANSGGNATNGAATDTARPRVAPPQPGVRTPAQVNPLNPPANQPNPNVMSREAMLEERIRELERRVKQLEEKLNPST